MQSLKLTSHLEDLADSKGIGDADNEQAMLQFAESRSFRDGKVDRQMSEWMYGWMNDLLTIRQHC